MDKWTIYYSDAVIHGNTESEWNDSPEHDVQIVVVHAPYDPPEFRPWSRINNHQIYTGTDEFSINGWKTKFGKLLDDEVYYSLWEKMIEEVNNA